MLSMKLLLTFSLLMGVFAKECGYGLEDFSNQVVVTNTSAVADAFVAVAFDHGQVTMYVEGGKSRTAIALAATEYTVKVTNPGSGEYGTYRDQLLATRDWLLDVTISASAPESAVAEAWTQLLSVQAALDQMTDSDKVQSCSGELGTGGTSQVTLQWLDTSDGTALWALDCG